MHWYCGSLSKIQYSQITTRKEYTDVDGLYFFGTTPVIISSLDYQLFDHYELDIVLMAMAIYLTMNGSRLLSIDARLPFFDKTNQDLNQNS